jgi:hypothetical protein
MSEAFSLKEAPEVRRTPDRPTSFLWVAVCAVVLLWASFVIRQVHAAGIPPASQVRAVVVDAETGLPLLATSGEDPGPGECESELAKLPK